MNINASWLFKLFEDFIDSFLKEILDLRILVSFKAIESWIFQNSAEKEAPSYPLDTILWISYLSSCNLSIYMIGKLRKKTRLYRERII